MSDKSSTAPAANETAEPKKGRGRGRRSMTPPAYDTPDNLMSLVQAHRTSTASDTARQFTAEGFKSAGGIDSLPATTRGFMAADLILSLANDAQSDEAAEAVLTTVSSFVSNAEKHASEAAKLASYTSLAIIEGIAPQKSNESPADFIARVAKGIKAGK